MALNNLQRHLQRIYEVDIPHLVEDFLITDKRLARTLDSSQAARDIPEKLLVAQAEDCVELSLYLDRDLVERLRNDDPTDRVHDGNIADLWMALEGVSHFLYLAWNAGLDRSVSLLELEMQAEVDKFVSTAFLFGLQDGGRIPAGLRERLFEGVGYDGSLDRRELRRYRDASYYAGRFCSRLEARYLRGKRPGSLVNEVRRFYRLGQRQKIDLAVGTA